MGLLNQRPKHKVDAPVIRREVVIMDKPKLKPKPSSSTLNGHRKPASNGLRVPSTTHRSARPTPSASPRASPGLSPRPASSSDADEVPRSRKRKLPTSSAIAAARKHRPSPAGSDRPDFSTSDSEDNDDWAARFDDPNQPKGRTKEQEDPERVLAHKALIAATIPAEEQERTGELKFKRKVDPDRKEKELSIIHAVDVASLKEKCVPIWGAAEDEVAVELQYPGTKERERYEMVYGKDKIDTVGDIKFVVTITINQFLDKQTQRTFQDIKRQLDRSSSEKIQDLKGFKDALSQFNNRILALHTDGTIARFLAKKHELRRDFVAFIKDQVYGRVVSPEIDSLKKYEAGSDNVYGELNHCFISKLLIEKCQMKSSQVFVDMGSGVGNVVLHAALEIGCESWGCEQMPNAARLAAKQKPEFEARCKLWGLRHGRVHLFEGDFTLQPKIAEVIKRADVILVNNQAFTPALNDKLLLMFMDLKKGCKVISLKSFVHDFKSEAYNANNIGQIFEVQTKLPWSQGDVSWTDSAGTYCISTKK